MSWSLGEIRALAIDAAKGTGIPDPLAEQAGRAVLWLQRAGMPGIEALAQYLVDLEKNGGQHHETRCPFHQGRELLAEREREKSLGLVYHPLLLIPALASDSDTSIRFTLDNTSLIVSRDGVAYTADRESLLVEQAMCEFVADSAEVATEPITRIGEENRPSIAVLEYFANKGIANESCQPLSTTEKIICQPGN